MQIMTRASLNSKNLLNISDVICTFGLGICTCYLWMNYAIFYNYFECSRLQEKKRGRLGERVGWLALVFVSTDKSGPVHGQIVCPFQGGVEDVLMY